jgi:uncharacterized membrane protein
MSVPTHAPANPRPSPGEAKVDRALAREPRALDADRGLAWLAQGWRLFRSAPLIWIAISVLIALGVLLLAWIPVVGQLATTLLMIQFAGGLMLGCRALDRGEALSLGHLIAGMKSHLSPLMVIGALYLAALFVLIVAVSLVTGGAVLALLKDGANTGSAVGSVIFALLAAAVFIVPLGMATWFAPALVTLSGVAPVDAMKLSFRGCLRNVLAMLVYGMLCLLLALLASIPAGLGWLVLLPILTGSVYAGYQDIYLQP